MLIEVIAWIRGLANGEIAGVGQLQFLQPILGLLQSAAPIGEKIRSQLVAVVILVVSYFAGARRFAWLRTDQRERPPEEPFGLKQ